MKYMKRLTLWVPKPLLDRFDRIVLRDGRRRSEVLRTLMVNFAQAEESGSVVRKTRDAAPGA